MQCGFCIRTGSGTGGVARSFTILLNCVFFPLSSPSRIFMRGFIDAPKEIPDQTSFDKE